jgi:flagellar basal-body rod modification protein FlgD
MASAVNTTGSSSSVSSALQQVQNNNQQLNEQSFLQLLSTQLANQDPDSPQDETQMLAQLAQFSTVEGVNNMATTESQMQASSLLGKTATALTSVNNNAVTVSGTVTSVRWDGTNTYVTIKDPTNGSTEVTTNEVTKVSN